MSPRCFVSWMIRVITSGHILLRFLKWSGWCSDYLLPASRFKTKGETRKLCAWNNIWVWRPYVRSKKKKTPQKALYSCGFRCWMLGTVWWCQASSTATSTWTSRDAPPGRASGAPPGQPRREEWQRSWTCRCRWYSCPFRSCFSCNNMLKM